MLGDYDIALSYEQKIYDWSDRFYEFTPDYTKGWTEYHIAKILYNMGDLEKGEEAIKASAQHFENVGDTCSGSHAYRLMAIFLARKGEYETALKLSDKAMETLLPMYGEEHFDIARVWNSRARIYAIAEDVANACTCWERAINIFEKVGAMHYVKKARHDMQRVLAGENHNQSILD